VVDYEQWHLDGGLTDSICEKTQTSFFRGIPARRAAFTLIELLVVNRHYRHSRRDAAARSQQGAGKRDGAPFASAICTRIGVGMLAYSMIFNGWFPTACSRKCERFCGLVGIMKSALHAQGVQVVAALVMWEGLHVYARYLVKSNYIPIPHYQRRHHLDTLSMQCRLHYSTKPQKAFTFPAAAVGNQPLKSSE